MKTWEQAKQNAVNLHWLATLLTGCEETAAGVTIELPDAAPDLFERLAVAAWPVMKYSSAIA